MSFTPRNMPIAASTLVKRHDADTKTGFAPKGRVVAVGAFCGVILCLMPLLFGLGNFLAGLLGGVRGAGFGVSLLGRLLTPHYVFWLLFSATFGAMMAAARRWSVRVGRFWYFNWQGTTTWHGLDDLLSLGAGTLLLWWVLYVSGAGALFYWLFAAVPVPGFVLHALWELPYSWLIRHMASVAPAAYVQAIMISLQNHPSLHNDCRINDYHYNAETGCLAIQIQAQNDATCARVLSTLQGFPTINSVVRNIKIDHKAV